MLAVLLWSAVICILVLERFNVIATHVELLVGLPYC